MVKLTDIPSDLQQKISRDLGNPTMKILSKKFKNSVDNKLIKLFSLSTINALHYACKNNDLILINIVLECVLNIIKKYNLNIINWNVILDIGISFSKKNKQLKEFFLSQYIITRPINNVIQELKELRIIESTPLYIGINKKSLYDIFPLTII